MALGDLDTLRDTITSRGIGTSGLASQAVQRSMIEGQNSLRSNLVESTSRLDQQAKQRRAAIVAEALKQQSLVQSQLTQGGGKGMEFDPNSPYAIVTYSPTSYDPSSGSGLGYKYTLQFAGGSQGRSSYIQANTIDELSSQIAELKQQGVQVVVPGTLSSTPEGNKSMYSSTPDKPTTLMTTDMQKLRQMGVLQTSDQALFQAQSRGRGISYDYLSYAAQSAFRESRGRMAGDVETPKQSTIQQLSSTVAKGGTVGINDRGRLVESYLNSYTLAANKSGREEDKARLYALTMGLQNGKAYEYLQSMLQGGR